MTAAAVSRGNYHEKTTAANPVGLPPSFTMARRIDCFGTTKVISKTD
jgi:hypothetical protein